MKIAVAHDYFNQGGGADEVAADIYAILPGSDLITTVIVQDRLSVKLRGASIKTSWMRHLPFMSAMYRVYFPLYPLAIATLSVKNYDFIITSSSGYAKGLKARKGVMHVCYCHNPMRWVWETDGYIEFDERLRALRWPAKVLLNWLRRWDWKAAQNPDYLITNSRYSANRLREAYGRTSEVIPPPIDTKRFVPGDVDEDFYLVLGRLVPYRRIEIAVQACTHLGKKLIVIGAGPDLGRIRREAGDSVTFLGWQPNEVTKSHLQRCRALIFTGVEDFGMVPLEAAACGRPTIAYKAGGALETVAPCNGIFFEEQTWQSLSDAIIRFEALKWSKAAIRAHAEGFSRDVFRDRLAEFLSKVGAPKEVVDVLTP